MKEIKQDAGLGRGWSRFFQSYSTRLCISKICLFKKFDEEDINNYLTGAEKGKEAVLLHDKICICLKRGTKVVTSSFYE